MRVGPCRDLIADIRRLAIKLAANEKADVRGPQGAQHPPARGRRHRRGRRGPADRPHRQADRFPTAAAYANYKRSAPVQISSADTGRHRLPRYGDRQLSSALYTVAVVQIQMPASAGRAYYDKTITASRKPAAARCALKRHLSDHVWRIMLSNERPRLRWQTINLPGQLDKQRGTQGEGSAPSRNYVTVDTADMDMCMCPPSSGHLSPPAYGRGRGGRRAELDELGHARSRAVRVAADPI